MHTIKRQARKHAWYGTDPNDGSNFNPFRKYRSHSPSRTRDVETGDAALSKKRPTWPHKAANALHVRSQHQNPEASANGVDGVDTPTDTIRTDYTGSERTMVGDNGEPGLAHKRRTNTGFNSEKPIPEGDETATSPSPSRDGSSTASTVDDPDARLSREEDKKRRHHESMKKKIPVMQQVKAVLFPSWYTINWLLICAPVGIALSQIKKTDPATGQKVSGVDPLAVFVVNFIAIVPLAGMLSFATEELAMRVGETLGGLLNATFGNAVELIVAIIALTKNEIIIVQTSLIGSILSNLLIVLGMCFFFGGLSRLEQHFNITVAQTAASLLALSVGSLLIPTAFTWSFNAAQSNLDEQLSHGTAIILLVVYGAYLFFQLKSHTDLYNEPSKKVEKRKRSKKPKGAAAAAIAGMGHSAAGPAGGAAHMQNKPEEDDVETPTLSMIGALVTLAGATALIGICSEFLVDSINEVTCKYNISEEFVGLILLPIVGNAAEHATAVTVACKDKMDLAIGVAVGSSMQIALLVIPFSVIIGWIIGADMTLVFDDFQIVVLFVAIILVNYLIGDGKSHWLEGTLLMALYIIIAVAAWFYPVKTAGQCAA